MIPERVRDTLVEWFPDGQSADLEDSLSFIGGLMSVDLWQSDDRVVLHWARRSDDGYDQVLFDLVRLSVSIVLDAQEYILDCVYVVGPDSGLLGTVLDEEIKSLGEYEFILDNRMDDPYPRWMYECPGHLATLNSLDDYGTFCLSVDGIDSPPIETVEEVLERLRAAGL